MAQGVSGGTVATTQELLDAVETAISARLSGGAVQSYSIGGRNLQYVSLKELYDIRDRLRAEVNTGTSRRNYAGIKGPL